MAEASTPPVKQGWYSRFKAAVKALKHECTAIAYAIQDPRCPWYARLIPFLVLAYALSPIDLIPDFIPILGLVDDLLLLPAMLWLALLVIPTQVLEDARAKAHAHPVRLARNWPMAVIIFILWTGLLLWGVYALCTAYGGETITPWAVHITAGTGAVATIAFVWWLVVAMRKDRRKRAKAAAAAAAAEGQEKGSGGGGVEEPLLQGSERTHEEEAQVPV